jgi:hypothetical protein
MKHRQRLHFIRSSVAAFGVVLSTLVLAPASGALASDRPATTGVQASSTWSMQTSGTNPVGRPAIGMSTYPGDCTPRSDYPHLGKYSNYTAVDAKGWIVCRTQRPSETVNSWLYRQDCFLFFCWLTQVGFDSKTCPPQCFSYGTVRAVPSHTCSGNSSHLYVIQSDHWLTDFDGTRWYSYTSAQSLGNLACG